MLDREFDNAPEALTDDQLELISGGGDLGPAAKIEAPRAITLGDVARFVFTGE